MVWTYNKCMGGVDLLDSLIGLYQTKIHSKKVLPYLDVTVVTSWLLYKRDCKEFCVPKWKELTLLQFKHCIVESLFRKGKSVTFLKRRRPSSVDKKLKVPIPNRYLTNHFTMTILIIFQYIYIRKKEEDASYWTAKAALTCFAKNVKFISA